MTYAALIRSLPSDMPASQVAAIVGCAIGTVGAARLRQRKPDQARRSAKCRYHARLNGSSSAGKPRAGDAMIRAEYGQGRLSAADLAVKLGYTRNAIVGRAKRLGLKKVAPSKAGRPARRRLGLAHDLAT